eukprot:3830505-Pleurochrysis_carterae.AAC.1
MTSSSRGWCGAFLWLGRKLALGGVKFGFYLTLTEHMPTKQIRRISQVPLPSHPHPHPHDTHICGCQSPLFTLPYISYAGKLFLQASCQTYDKTIDVYKPRVLFYHPYNANDVVYVPSVFPSLNSFSVELKAFSAEHQLVTSAVGQVAVLDLERIAHDVANETVRVMGKSLSHFSSARFPMRLSNQLDAARRRTRRLVACVVKTPQLKSQSCFALRLLALGVGFKDDRHGAQQLLQTNFSFIEHLLNIHEVVVPEICITGDEDGERV